MKTILWAFASLIMAMLVQAAPASAATGFTGVYDYSTWSKTETKGNPTVSSIDATKQTLTLKEPDNVPGGVQEFDFSHVAAGAGTVSFDWIFDARVDPCCSGLNFYVNGALIANLAGGTFAAPGNFPSAFASGTFSTQVKAGDLLTFGAFSADGCCGASTSTITNFNAPVLSAVPEPATWSMMILGFGLVGGAMRRRKAGRRTAAYA